MRNIAIFLLFLLIPGLSYSASCNKSEFISYATKGNLDMLKCAIVNGANINQQDEDGWTALIYATRWARVDVVKYLVQIGANLDAMTTRDYVCKEDCDMIMAGSTALIIANQMYNYASESYKQKSYQKIIDILKGITCEKEKAIEYAKSGNIEMIKCLIKSGFDINDTDSEGNTLLIGASEVSIETVKFLLDNGAVVNIANYKGITPLMRAVFNNRINIVKLLINKGANVKSVDKERNNVLMYAISSLNAEIIMLIIDNGASVDTVNSHGETPLMKAVSSNVFGIAKLLVDMGVDIDATDSSGNTALDIAREKKYNNIVKMLEQSVATSCDPAKIITYATKGDMPSLRCALNNGADINQQDEDGWTPLIYATRWGNVNAVRYLVNNDARAYLTTKNDYICKQDCTVIARGMSALDIAKQLSDEVSDVKKKRIYVDIYSILNSAMPPEMDY